MSLYRLSYINPLVDLSFVLSMQLCFSTSKNSYFLTHITTANNTQGICKYIYMYINAPSHTLCIDAVVKSIKNHRIFKKFKGQQQQQDVHTPKNHLFLPLADSLFSIVYKTSFLALIPHNCCKIHRKLIFRSFNYTI
jgi:hypothetical protein